VRDSEQARNQLNGHVFNGRPIDIHFALPKDEGSDFPEDKNTGTLFITLRNVSSSPTNSALQRYFEKFGQVREVRDCRNSPNQKFIEFFDVRAAQKAYDEKPENLQWESGTIDIKYAHLQRPKDSGVGKPSRKDDRGRSPLRSAPYSPVRPPRYQQEEYNPNYPGSSTPLNNYPGSSAPLNNYPGSSTPLSNYPGSSTPLNNYTATSTPLNIPSTFFPQQSYNATSSIGNIRGMPNTYTLSSYPSIYSQQLGSLGIDQNQLDSQRLMLEQMSQLTQLLNSQDPRQNTTPQTTDQTIPQMPALNLNEMKQLAMLLQQQFQQPRTVNSINPTDQPYQPPYQSQNFHQ